MKRQTLQVGSALLATTALSTFSTLAMAGSIENSNTLTAGGTLLTPISLSAQVFGGTTPGSINLGPTEFDIDFTNALTTSFNVDIDVTGAKFDTTTATPIVTTFQESAGSLTVASGVTGCSIQVLTERILVSSCLATELSTGCRIDVMRLSGINFNQANGLATAGTSISVAGIVKGSAGNQTFETISSGNIVTSVDSLQISAVAASAVTLSNTATPPFSNLGGTPASTTATLGSVNTSLVSSTGTSLASSITVASNIVGSLNFTVTHGVLTDAAVTKLTLVNGSASITPSSFVGNVASFNPTVSAAVPLPASYQLQVDFDGTTAIQAWAAGTITATPSAGALARTAPAGVTGSLAALNRGGFQAQINTAQSSVVADFDSFVRITNNGAVAGTATIAVANDADGTVLGTYTTATIAPNATIQVSMPTIEAGATPAITPAGQYMLNISGSISGYAQHVMLNTANGTFVDLSGFRIGNATTGFP